MSRDLDRSMNLRWLRVGNMSGNHINYQSSRCLSDNRAIRSIFWRKPRFFDPKILENSISRIEVGPVELFGFAHYVVQVTLLLYSKRSWGTSFVLLVKIGRQVWSPSRKSDKNSTLLLVLACTCRNRLSKSVFRLFLID